MQISKASIFSLVVYSRKPVTLLLMASSKKYLGGIKKKQFAYMVSF